MTTPVDPLDVRQVEFEPETMPEYLRQAAWHGGYAKCIIRMVLQTARRDPYGVTLNFESLEAQAATFARSAFRWARGYLDALAAQPSEVERPPLHQRAWDLLRQMRHHLQDEDLITDDEYAWLVTQFPDGVGRLEGYDAMRQRAEKAEADLVEVTRERDAYIELEGRLCPEDVGFEEFIAVLRKKLTSPPAPSGWPHPCRSCGGDGGHFENCPGDGAPSGWQPIASAPKDGTSILCLSASLGHVIARFDGDRQSAHDALLGRTFWRVDWDGDYLSSEPPYWMPLPPAPGTEATNHCSQAMPSGCLNAGEAMKHHLECRELLADCYRGMGGRAHGRMLTHAVVVNEQRHPVSVVCGRVALDSIADVGPSDQTPTCQSCRKKTRGMSFGADASPAKETP